MAIDPNLTTTIRTGELPPLPLELESNIAHELGDTLYRSTIQELVNFIRSNSVSYPYEKRDIIVPNPEYITDNFDMIPNATQGLGKAEGLWEGWAICNGNNGTPNLDGQTLIGFGANYSTVGQFLGSKDAIVVSHSHTVDAVYNENITGTVVASGGGTIESTGTQNVSTTGVDGTDKNMQPSMVVLMIMRLP